LFGLFLLGFDRADPQQVVLENTGDRAVSPISSPRSV
jgi:hypothetical protein